MDSKDLKFDELSEMFNENPDTKSWDRRKKSDWVTKTPVILSIVVWCVLIAVWAILEQAAPDTEFGLFASFGRVVFDLNPILRTRWNYALVFITFILLCISIVISVLAIIFNRMRMKRKTDRYRKSVFISGGVTVIALIAFLIRFGYVIF